MRKSNYLILQLFLCVCLSCNEEAEKTPSKEEQLLQGWTLFSEEDSFNLTTSLQDCQKDDVYKFSLDGTYTVTAGQSKCEASEPDPSVVTPFKWIGTNEPKDLSDMGLQRLLSVTSGLLKTQIDFSGRSSIMRTYTVVKENKAVCGAN